MPHTRFLTSLAVTLTILAAPLAAHAARAEQDQLFVLSGSKRSSHISYDEYQKVRVCVDKASVSEPLRIQHGLGTNMVQPGTCYTFQSTEFKVSTRGLLPDEQIVGRVEALDE